MKNGFLTLVMCILMMSCEKQSTTEEPSNKWNGYSRYLKTGEIVHTLWAGQHINVGTVTYGLDANANFYVTYDCSASGWKISETHMFAGDKINMPLNKPGSPKIGQFPNSRNHSPRVSNYTYRVPLTSLPPCEEPGFVVAAHCVVHSPAGRTETAWAEGDYTFCDKGWGWYDVYFYNQVSNQVTTLYGTVCDADTLNVYLIVMNNEIACPILKEYVGNAPGNYNGAAYDHESGMFFFTNYNTNELWLNQLTTEDPSFCAGTLSGPAASGTFYDGDYYYVNDNLNICQVAFTGNWTISTETILDTIPGQVTVNDIAMDPDGEYLYIMGQYNGGTTELISWDIGNYTFYTNSISLNEGAQIAYGSDGVLYAIAPDSTGNGLSHSYEIILCDGVMTELSIHDDIIIEDPLSDLSGGPIQ